jgi:uncharacterized protein YhaN
MKIRRLDLIAYGPFQNEQLKFETDNLQLIFGPNEAGKSTVLRALQAVLYGMTEKRDAFLHPWDMMRVGMTVETAEGVIRVERRKGKGVRSLVYAGTDRSVSAEEWNRVLPVLDEDLFAQMFGIDYQRLVEGGRALAQGKGDIGEALLAAAGDLGGAMESKREFERRAGDLFQPHARSQSKLSVALREYKEADKRIRSEKFSSHAYRTAVRELEDMQGEGERLAGEIRSCAREQQRLIRLQQAAPAVALLAQKEGEIAAMSPVPVLGADFATRHEKAIKLLSKAVTTAENSQTDLSRLTEKLATIQRNPALAGLKVEIERLFAQSGKIDASREDRPKREGKLGLLREGVTRNLRLLGLGLDPADCADLRVKVVQRSEINRLVEEYARLTTRLQEDTRRAEILDADIDANWLALQGLPTLPDTAELERSLSAVAGAPTETDLGKLRNQLAAAEKRAESDLKALPLFGGSGEQLQDLQTPLAATVRVYQARYTQQDAAERQLATDGAGAHVGIAKLEQQIQQLENQGEVPTESDLDQSRARRELGWTAVKHRWLNGEPDTAAEPEFLSGTGSGQALDAAYEGAVRHADGIADGLRINAGRVEKKVLWLDQVAHGAENLAQIRGAIKEATARRQELDRDWRALWAPASIEPLSPVEMLDWLDRRAEVVEQLRTSAALRQQVNQSEDQIRLGREALKMALHSLNINSEGTLAELLEMGRRIVQRGNDARTQRRDLEREQKRLQVDRTKAERQRSDLDQARAEWDRQWATATTGLPVPADAEPDAVQEVVQLLDKVAADSEQINDLVHRIQTMERDDHDFSAAVGDIAARSGVALQSADALITIRGLYDAATDAKQREDAAAACASDIEHASEGLYHAQLAAERQHKELAALCSEAGVQEPDLLGTAIAQSNRRRDLSSQAEEQRSALIPACAGRSLGELKQAVAALDMDALPAQLADLESRQLEYDRQKQECAGRALDLERDFQLHESSAALSQAATDKQAAGARIVDLAEEYLEQQIAARLMNVAIERYRSRHQDPLLERAGQYLNDLTCGSFTGLTVDFDDANRRVLRAVRSGSADHVDIAGLSDGARDQLFFALRLAYIEDHSSRVGQCPVILDDVLMAFDNARATAALRVLSQFSKKTQVLLFTHHAHHIELARQAIPSKALTVHELVAGQPVGA